MNTLSLSRSARYHRTRRTRLLNALGRSCTFCGADVPVQIAHLHGNGGSQRRSLGNAGEITRLLGLSLEQLCQEVALLCGPCHVEHDRKAGHLDWKSYL